jgi:hypothetical protein
LLAFPFVGPWSSAASRSAVERPQAGRYGKEDQGGLPLDRLLERIAQYPVVVEDGLR